MSTFDQVYALALGDEGDKEEQGPQRPKGSETASAQR